MPARYDACSDRSSIILDRGLVSRESGTISRHKKEPAISSWKQQISEISIYIFSNIIIALLCCSRELFRRNLVSCSIRMYHQVIVSGLNRRQQI